uniref:Secreted protein n=1 Tax=Anopheles minimus TaxID=112268 RepID=A0A182VYX8_9DIPT
MVAIRLFVRGLLLLLLLLQQSLCESNLPSTPYSAAFLANSSCHFIFIANDISRCSIVAIVSSNKKKYSTRTGSCLFFPRPRLRQSVIHYALTAVGKKNNKRNFPFGFLKSQDVGPLRARKLSW